MKTVVYLGIALRIIILFGTGMAVSYMNPHLHQFLGDKPHVCQTEWCSHSNATDGYEWGTPHYWYNALCVLLFLLSLVNVILSVRNLILNHYREFF